MGCSSISQRILLSPVRATFNTELDDARSPAGTPNTVIPGLPVRAEPGIQRDTARTAEHARLALATPGRPGEWKAVGPYVSERAWGTVREDYSADGRAWEYFPHDHARSRAYRWNEDGLAGICDLRQRMCLALAL